MNRTRGLPQGAYACCRHRWTASNTVLKAGLTLALVELRTERAVKHVEAALRGQKVRYLLSNPAWRRDDTREPDIRVGGADASRRGRPVPRAAMLIGSSGSRVGKLKA